MIAMGIEENVNTILK